jgi:hypothetical protein
VIVPPSKLAEEFQLPRLEERQFGTSFEREWSSDYALVRAGKWREAGEHFVTRSQNLERVVWSAYQANRIETKDAEVQDRYAFGLLHFVFWHVNQLPCSMNGSTPWVEYARHYQALAMTTKLPGEERPLDMSQIDLLEEAFSKYLAAGEALEFLQSDGMSASSVVWHVYVLYRDAGQLRDLQRMASSADQKNGAMRADGTQG